MTEGNRPKEEQTIHITVETDSGFNRYVNDVGSVMWKMVIGILLFWGIGFLLLAALIIM